MPELWTGASLTILGIIFKRVLQTSCFSKQEMLLNLYVTKQDVIDNQTKIIIEILIIYLNKYYLDTFWRKSLNDTFMKSLKHADRTS